MDLKDACSAWQSGRDGGSSMLRGAARELTGIPHYFDAAYIREYQREAAGNPVTMERGRVLMTAVADSEPRTPDGWCTHLGIPASGFSGRGLERKDKKEDDQIHARLREGETIDMPLWGVSLDRQKAIEFGRGGLAFLLELEGPFHGVAAWPVSGLKPEEREIITGGRYVVTSAEDRHGTTYATLREREQLWPSVG